MGCDIHGHLEIKIGGSGIIIVNLISLEITLSLLGWQE